MKAPPSLTTSLVTIAVLPNDLFTHASTPAPSPVESSYSYSYSYSMAFDDWSCETDCSKNVISALNDDDFGTLCHLSDSGDLDCLDDCGSKNGLFYAALCACDVGTTVDQATNFIDFTTSPYCCGSSNCQSAIYDYEIDKQPGFANPIWDTFISSKCNTSSIVAWCENQSTSGTFYDCGTTCSSTLISAYQRGSSEEFCGLDYTCESLPPSFPQMPRSSTTHPLALRPLRTFFVRSWGLQWRHCELLQLVLRLRPNDQLWFRVRGVRVVVVWRFLLHGSWIALLLRKR